MNDKIDIFLEKWNDMIIAANAIEEFRYEFNVSISSKTMFIHEREGMITGINKSFADNGMRYSSRSTN